MLRSLVAGRLRTGPAGGGRAVLDVVAVALVLGTFWLPLTFDAADPGLRAVGGALATVSGAAMVLRRRLPRAAPLAAGVATVAGNALGVCQDPMLAAAWCLYPLAVARASRTGYLPLTVVALVAALSAVVGIPGQGDGRRLGQWLVIAVAALSAAWLLGTAVGRQVAAAREAERARVHMAVAREVHDVVGHALGVISAEAGVTRGLPDTDERELRDALGRIELHARGALEEVQALVRGLRQAPDAGPGRTAADELVGRLSSVVDTTRAAGVGVQARIRVHEHVDGAVGAAVLRIVQESLSNVVRHAAGASCTVDVYEKGDAMVVRVRDRGPGAPADRPSGFGLPGMRERAQLVGGSVCWGDHAEGGFEVRAHLPVRGAG